MTGRAPVVPSSVAVLEPFVAAGVFDAGEVQLAAAVARLVPGTEPSVLLAVAVAARAPRLGHVGIELAVVAERLLDHHQRLLPPLPWPEADRWAADLAASPAVDTDDDRDDLPPGGSGDRVVAPLRWDGVRIYLQRYWRHEVEVARHLLDRAAATPMPHAEAEGSAARAALDALFPPLPDEAVDLQRRAAATALSGRLAVVAGGPGTGKTRTIARLLAAAHLRAEAEGQPLEVALAAPTGKAAARMTEAVRLAVAETQADGAIDDTLAEKLQGTEATTLHRLLGWRPGPDFRHDAHDPLPHDLVVVDEASMVSLPLMARLLAAVRPDAGVVLVGDPHQLASVEAGTVLSDVVGPVGSAASPISPDSPAPVAESGPLAPRLTVLQRVHRFGARSGIALLADAVRDGRTDEVVELLRGGAEDLAWVSPEDAGGLAALSAAVVDQAEQVVAAALAGRPAHGLDAALALKVLTATRQGPNSLREWSARIEDGVADRVPGYERHRRWAVGRPVLITENDPLNRVANGDVGLVVPDPHGRGAVVALPEGGGEVRLLPASRLRATEPWWAMTIHKSQGSEFPHVVVALPPTPSPILTRELLYTAATRAKQQLTVVADEASLRAAVARPVARASGLRDRLWAP